MVSSTIDRSQPRRTVFWFIPGSSRDRLAGRKETSRFRKPGAYPPPSRPCRHLLHHLHAILHAERIRFHCQTRLRYDRGNTTWLGWEKISPRLPPFREE